MRRMILPAVMLCLPLVRPVVRTLVPAARAQETPARVLTDTPEYCLDLARRVAARPDLPESAQLLSDEGQRLCAHGHVIAGIARLRRAMVVLEHPDAP